jgi:hypothetical protein
MPVWTDLPLPGGSQAIVSGPEGTELDSVGFNDSPASPAAPPNATFPYGVLSFSLRGVTAGGTATIDVELPEPVNAYYMLSPDGTGWQLFDWDGMTGAQFDGNVVHLTVQDGGRGDADGVANGTVVNYVNDGAPAISVSPTPVPP